MKSNQRGFTLIELLIVIAIIAVLAVAVILTLNPAELLRQSRDSSRLSDMATLKSAIALYLSDVTSPNLASTTAGYADCYTSSGANGTTTAKCSVFVGAGITANSSTASRAVDATGWLPVHFDLISAQAPFGNLPVDPVNNANYYYAYAANSNLQYELDTRMESQKYTTGSNNVGANTNDGGDNNTWYETGTNLTL